MVHRENEKDKGPDMTRVRFCSNYPLWGDLSFGYADLKFSPCYVHKWYSEQEMNDTILMYVL